MPYAKIYNYMTELGLIIIIIIYIYIYIYLYYKMAQVKVYVICWIVYVI